jgi:protein involved in polysaccharide export with SLBB domain
MHLIIKIVKLGLNSKWNFNRMRPLMRLQHQFILMIHLCLLVTSVPLISIASDADKKTVSETPKNYGISPNDLVEVIVYREPDLDTKARVNEDGTITLPLLGVIKIGSLSVTEAASLIKRELGAKYLVNPQVTVSIAEFSKRQFTVMGSVKQPGVYALPNNKSIDLLQALASAGGFTRMADMRRVTVRRQVNGVDEVIKVDAKQNQKEGEKLFLIQSGDTIHVYEKLL